MNAIPSKQSGTAIRTLIRVASAASEERFVKYALVEYFERIMSASSRKLKAYGLRPVVAPVAAEFALNRVQCARTYPEFIARLIDDDEYVAEIAMRAVKFYAGAFPNNGTAQSVLRNLSYIAPATH